jgi:hypothetical protein
MTRIVLALLVLCALGGGPSIQGAPPVPPVPFKAGDTWVYRVTQTAGSRLGTNTLTMRYLGKRDYRGTLYHFSDSHSSSSPGVVERDILTWSGLYFRQRATILYENSQQTLEIVFDRPYAFSGIPEELSGTIEIYERSQYAGKGSWAIEVVWGGTVKVTVPAGTFTAEKWKGTLRIGRLKKDYTVYTVGPLEIKTDIDVLKGGELMDRTRTELVKGPIPKH